jgi:hypothetical protein
MGMDTAAFTSRIMFDGKEMAVNAEKISSFKL